LAKKKAKATKKKAKAAKKPSRPRKVAAKKPSRPRKAAAKKPSRPRRKLPQRSKKKVFTFTPEEQRQERPAQAPERRIAPWLCSRRSPTRDARVHVTLGPKLELDWTLQLGAPAAGAPVVADDGALYVGDREGGLHAIDVERGERRFQLHTDPILEASPAWPLVDQGLVPANRVPVSASPAILRWHLFFGDDEGIFYNVRRGDAQTLWRKAAPLTLASRSGGAYQAPFAVGDMVYTADADGNLYAAWTRSGKTVFSRFLRGRPAAPPALGLGGQRVLITTAPLYPSEPALLHALDATRGDRCWTAELPADPSPALATARNHALVGSVAGLTAFRLYDGARSWHRQLEHGVGGGLAVDAQRIYAPVGQSVQAFALDGGSPLWEVSTGDGKLAPLVPGAGLTVSGDVVWVPAERSLIALAAETGKVLARQRVPGKPVGELVVAADRLIVATDSGELRAYRPA
jgi:outer membrane protein assembly factor BamB